MISFWFTRGADCVDDQDGFDEVARDYEGRVNFLSINVRDDRETVEDIVDERGWTVPVGWDRDGAVSNLYRIGVCPTVAFAFPGGIFQSAEVGDEALDPAELSERVDDLLAESRERETRMSGDELVAGPVAPELLRGAPRPVPARASWSSADPGAARPRCATGCEPSRTGSPAPRRSTCATSRSPGPTGSSTATSGSTPTSSRPRSRRWCWSG